MPTAAQLKAQRKQLEDELAKDLRIKDRARLRALKERVRAAKRARRGRLRDVKASCRDARQQIRISGREKRDAARQAIVELKAQIKDLREQLRALPRATRAAAREAASSCAVDVDTTRADVERELAQALAALEQERGDQQLQRIYRGRAKLKEAPRRSRREEAQESDDEVRNNLSHDLIPIFERVKRGIRAGPRRTRTEAFLEWVHDHPGKVLEIIEEDAQRDIERLEREERRFAKRMREPRRYRRSAPELAAELEAAIPF